MAVGIHKCCIIAICFALSHLFRHFHGMCEVAQEENVPESSCMCENEWKSLVVPRKVTTLIYWEVCVKERPEVKPVLFGFDPVLPCIHRPKPYLHYLIVLQTWHPASWYILVSISPLTFYHQFSFFLSNKTTTTTWILFVLPCQLPTLSLSVTHICIFTL